MDRILDVNGGTALEFVATPLADNVDGILDAVTTGVETADAETADISGRAADNYLRVGNQPTGSAPYISAVGTDANVSMNLYSKGTGGIILRSSQNGPILNLTPVDSGVNYLQINNAAAGGIPAIYATGVDANVPLNLNSKGTGNVAIRGSSPSTISLLCRHIASAVNYIQIDNAVTGSPASISTNGSDTDVSLNFATKGAGKVTVEGVPVATTTGVETLTGKTLTSPRVNQLNDTNGVAVLVLVPQASAVNYWQAANSIAGQTLALYAQGTDTNINAAVFSKGTGVVSLRSSTTGTIWGATPVANGVNYLNVLQAAAGASPTIQAVGADANLSVYISPKGAGGLTVTDSDADGTANIAVHGTAAAVNLDLRSKGTGKVQANGVNVATATDIATREPVIAAGTTAQYLRGDKTWQTLPVAPVSSVAGRTGAVVLAKADVGLAAAVEGSNAGTAAPLTLWTGTKAQYDAIATKSATTVYVVTGTPTYDPMAGSAVTADQKPIIEPKAT
jgi:hypothetical protein